MRWNAACRTRTGVGKWRISAPDWRIPLLPHSTGNAKQAISQAAESAPFAESHENLDIAHQVDQFFHVFLFPVG
jgi:hypothetical protein